MLPQPLGGRQCFPRVHRILKHRFLCYGYKQTFLPEFVQTHVHWVSDATQPSHPLLSPSPPALSLSQHQSLFKWVSSSHQVAKVLEFQLNISPSKEDSVLFRLGLTGLISLKSKGLSRVFSNTTVQEHQFFGTQLSLWYNSNIHTWKIIALTRWTFVSKVMSLFCNMLSRFVIAFPALHPQAN